MNFGRITKEPKGRGATLIVAASNASMKSRKAADYVCDGIDDQVEIQAAVDTINTSGFGNVLLTEGTYILTPSAITGTYSAYKKGITIRSNVALHGNPGSRIKWNTTELDAQSILIFGDSITDTEIKGINFDGENKTNTFAGIFVVGAFDRVRIENNYLHNIIHNPIYFDNGASSTGIISNNIIKNCSGMAIGIHNAPKYAIVSNNYIYQDEHASLYWGGGIMLDTVTNVVVANNNVHCKEYSMYLFDGSSTNTIVGNIFNTRKSGYAGIYFDYSSGKAASSNNIFTGNKITGITNSIKILANGGDGNLFLANNINGAISDLGTGNIYKNNLGYVTENKGTATVANGATYVDVTHGLSKTPLAQDVVIIPTNNKGNATEYWVSDLGDSTFRINVDSDPGVGTATFAWQIT